MKKEDWIPVTKDTPKHSKNVLVSVSLYGGDELIDEYVTIDRYFHWREGNWYKTIIKNPTPRLTKVVNAWQELPETY